MLKNKASLVVKTALLWLFLCLAAGAPIVIGAPDADVDLAISKTDSVDPVTAGEALTYRLTITNTGPSIATGVAFTDTLPGGVTFASASSGCTYNTASRTVRCDRGDVGIGSVSTATIQVLVDPGTTGSLLNQATVGTLDTDLNLNNNTAQITTSVTRSADLVLGMSAPATAIAGGLITYTFTITNSGPSNASGVSLQDNFSPGTTYTGSSVPCTRQGLVLTCDVGSIAASSLVSPTITFRIDPGRTAALTNDALVTATTLDPDTTNNDASLTTPLTISSDITISKDGTPDQIAPGELLTYTIKTTNNGLSTGQGVQITDTLPVQVLVQSYTATQGTCTGTGTTTITCTQGSVTPTGTITVTLVGLVDPTASPGIITNTVNVTSTSPDPTPTNNSASVRTTITDETADLQITKRDLIDPVRAGETLTYTITVSNTGPASASGVVVTDTLPISVTLASISSSQGTCTGTICALGTISTTNSAVITMAVTVNPSATGVITNTVAVSANEEDPVSGNNSAQVTTAIVQEAELSIVKTGTPEPVFAGRNLTYRLQIRNQGPSSANNVHVIDDLPAEVSFVSAPAGCLHSSETVDCSLGRMLPGSSVVVTITTQAELTATGLTTNSASLSSNATDPLPSNNESDWISNILAPDHVLPTISWLQPVQDGQRLNVSCEIVHLQVNATDNVAIQRVYFYRWDPNILDYVDIGYDYTAPYEWDIDTCALSANWNQVFADAQDTYGNLNWSSLDERKFIWLYRHMIFLPVISK